MCKNCPCPVYTYTYMSPNNHLHIIQIRISHSAFRPDVSSNNAERRVELQWKKCLAEMDLGENMTGLGRISYLSALRWFYRHFRQFLFYAKTSYRSDVKRLKNQEAASGPVWGRSYKLAKLQAVTGRCLGYLPYSKAVVRLSKSPPTLQWGFW